MRKFLILLCFLLPLAISPAFCQDFMGMFGQGMRMFQGGMGGGQQQQGLGGMMGPLGGLMGGGGQQGGLGGLGGLLGRR